VDKRQFQFEWDEVKAAANVRKHDVSFELASTIFRDPRLLTLADLEHNDLEERWFSLGCSATAALLAVSHLWSETDTSTITIRVISARQATRKETRCYQEGL
jgi:uncharacterized DUF497 family protein